MYQLSLRPRPLGEHWRNLAEYWHLSPRAKERLEWMIFYQTVGKKNARFAASYFGISRKTLRKRKKRFNPHLIQSLEEKSRAPWKKRQWEVTKTQEERVIALKGKNTSNMARSSFGLFTKESIRKKSLLGKLRE